MKKEDRPQIQFPFRYSLRIEVGGQRRDVSNISVVHKSREGYWAAMQEIQDLKNKKSFYIQLYNLQSRREVLLPGTASVSRGRRSRWAGQVSGLRASPTLWYISDNTGQRLSRNSVTLVKYACNWLILL